MALGGFCALADKRYRARNKKTGQDLKAGELQEAHEAYSAWLVY